VCGKLLKAKFYDWAAVREMVAAAADKQSLVLAQPAGRWSALHQAAEVAVDSRDSIAS